MPHHTVQGQDHYGIYYSLLVRLDVDHRLIVSPYSSMLANILPMMDWLPFHTLTNSTSAPWTFYSLASEFSISYFVIRFVAIVERRITFWAPARLV